MSSNERATRAAEIRALRAQGQSVRAIAAQLGVSRSRLYQILAADRAATDEWAVRARFPMLSLELAARLAPRYPRRADGAAEAGGDGPQTSS